MPVSFQTLKPAYIPRRVVTCFAVLACSLCLTILFSNSAQAITTGPISSTTSFEELSPIDPSLLTPLQITLTDTRYPLASVAHSSGFIPVSETVQLEDAITTLGDKNDIGTAEQSNTPLRKNINLEPDFKTHHRYWLATKITNMTDNEHWVLHISSFAFQQPRVLVIDGHGHEIKVFDNRSVDINTIGQALNVRLEPQKTYVMVVELTAYHVTWYPYIALMSDHAYEEWALQMDFAFKLAIGAIMGMILLGLICWLLMSEMAIFWGSISSLLMLFYYLEHSSLPALFWQSDYEKTALFWLLLSATILFQLAFAASFIKIKRQSGYWYQVFMATAAITVLVYLLSPFLSIAGKSFLYAFNYTLLWVVILSSGVVKVWSEGRYYIIYILGWLPPILSILHVVLFIVLPHKQETEIDVSYKIIHVIYVQILHMMIHAVALILRVRELRRDKLEAEFISQAKSRFIAHSSHDLHQPLHTMRLMLDTLQPHIQGKQAKSLFEGLTKTQKEMSDSFNTIMDLGKLEAGVIKAEPETLSLAGVFAKIQNDFRLLAKEKGIDLRIHPCTAVVHTDPLLLERMLRNLLSNAIKYTDTGRVALGCRRRSHTVIIQVMDTGPGIAEQDQACIFDMYRRSAKHQKQFDGSGIGLSIVKHISSLLNHSVKLSSVAGKGSVFSIEIPRGSPLQTASAQSLHEKTAVQVALLIETTGLRKKIVDRLNDYSCEVRSFSSLLALQESKVAVDILIFDTHLLNATALAQQDNDKLVEKYVVACLCDPGVKLPKNWVALSTALLPFQLRALLNYGIRRQQVLE